MFVERGDEGLEAARARWSRTSEVGEVVGAESQAAKGAGPRCVKRASRQVAGFGNVGPQGTHPPLCAMSLSAAGTSVCRVWILWEFLQRLPAQRLDRDGGRGGKDRDPE
jgi:hypothetical protein